MQLKFHAKCGEGEHPPALVPFPGVKTVGRLHNYVGCQYDAATRRHVPQIDPVVVDSASEAGRELARRCRFEYSLWPADEATATLCGRPFVKLAQLPDGQWVPVSEDEALKAGLVKQYADGKRKPLCQIAGGTSRAQSKSSTAKDSGE